ncbi:MAG: FtsQ-type POTRA domain-containing protein [Proteobacteria bacterium]|nr:FtsQ-type POTRA domain-containing protein [Pseudomonadota bacterium]
MPPPEAPFVERIEATQPVAETSEPISLAKPAPVAEPTRAAEPAPALGAHRPGLENGSRLEPVLTVPDRTLPPEPAPSAALAAPAVAPIAAPPRPTARPTRQAPQPRRRLWHVRPSATSGAPRRAPSHRQWLVAAGIAGVVVFAGASGFGRNVRLAEPVSAQLDTLLVSAGFGINEIALKGHRQTLDSDIFRALNANGATLLGLDIAAARRRIEALPWVEQATLERVLPDKLNVIIRERHASAVWLDGDRTALVDPTGRVLAYLAEFVPSDLPRIAGPGAPAAAAELLTALSQYPGLAARLHIARRIGERRWDLELQSGTRVRLPAGPLQPALARLAHLDRDAGLLARPGDIVDLTVPNSVAVSPAASTSRRAAETMPPGRPL